MPNTQSKLRRTTANHSPNFDAAMETYMNHWLVESNEAYRVAVRAKLERHLGEWSGAFRLRAAGFGRGAAQSTTKSVGSRVVGRGAALLWS